MKLKSADIIRVLQKRHSDAKWQCFEELRLGSGYGFHERRIDFFAIDCAPSRGNRAVAYEVKVSRGDFLRDIGDERKQRGARLYSNEFYFAAPKGLIESSDLPVWAGLIEIDPEKCGQSWYVGKTAVTAAYREKWRPSWPFVVSVARSSTPRAAAE